MWGDVPRSPLCQRHPFFLPLALVPFSFFAVVLRSAVCSFVCNELLVHSEELFDSLG